MKHDTLLFDVSVFETELDRQSQDLPLNDPLLVGTHPTPSFQAVPVPQHVSLLQEPGVGAAGYPSLIYFVIER